MLPTKVNLVFFKLNFDGSLQTHFFLIYQFLLMSSPDLGGGLNSDKISFFRLFPTVILQSLSRLMLFYDAHIK